MLKIFLYNKYNLKILLLKESIKAINSQNSQNKMEDSGYYIDYNNM